MGTPAIDRDGDAFPTETIRPVDPSDPSNGLNPTESVFPTETIRPVDPSDPSKGLNPTESIFPTETIQPASTASWEHQYDFRPGKFTPTDYSFDLPGGGDPPQQDQAVTFTAIAMAESGGSTSPSG